MKRKRAKQPKPEPPIVEAVYSETGDRAAEVEALKVVLGIPLDPHERVERSTDSDPTPEPPPMSV